MLFVDLLSRDI